MIDTGTLRRFFPMLAITGIVLLGADFPATAAPVKIACFTKRILVQQEGAPTVILATFDEDARTAELFVKDYGGILKGNDVLVSPDTILFKFTTSGGEHGEATIFRPTGSMLLTIHRNPDAKVLADCQKQPEKRF